MYCTSNIHQGQNQSGFLTGSNSYMAYPPTSMSQNMLNPSTYSSSTSTLGSGGQTIFSWAHTVPTYMPWAPKHEQGNSEGLPSVVRFMAPGTTGPTDPCTSQTATTWELIHNLGNTCSGVHTANQHLKRRSDIDSDEEATPRPVKQYISEEKMAAKLSQMHISQDGKANSNKTCDGSYKNRTKKTDCGSWSSFSEDVSEESESEDTTSTALEGNLILSPELKQIIKPNPDLVKALLQERTKPSMALVLWQPPGGSVREKIERQLQHASSKICVDCVPDTRNNNDNNSSSSTNNNNSIRSNLNISTGSQFIPLQFQPSIPCNSAPTCLEESDDMEL